jgi:hypothetical protein
MATETKVDLFAGLPPIFAEIAPAERHGKYDTTRPFVIGPHVHATDGRIACRVLLSDVPAYVPTDNVGPPADKAFADAHTSVEVDIPECDGPKMGKCPECDGSGGVECNFGYDHDCENCDGSGEVEILPEPITVSGYRIAVKYMRLLRKHGFTTMRLPAQVKIIHDKGRSQPGEMITADHEGIEIVLALLASRDA